MQIGYENLFFAARRCHKGGNDATPKKELILLRMHHRADKSTPSPCNSEIKSKVTRECDHGQVETTK